MVSLDHPEALENLHRDFQHAGSDIVEAFTYNGHREKMRVIGKEELLEPLNRAVFSFNTIFDKVAVRPVAILYRGILPEFVRNRIAYSLDNLSMPVTTINNILQFEFGKAGVSTARFVI